MIYEDWIQKSNFEAVKTEIKEMLGHDWQSTTFFSSSVLNREMSRGARRRMAISALKQLEKEGIAESMLDPNFRELYWRLR